MHKEVLCTQHLVSPDGYIVYNFNIKTKKWTLVHFHVILSYV